MHTSFFQLNEGWNAEPNAPEPAIEIQGPDLLLSFYVNAFQYYEFEEEEIGILRFVHCERYRLGSTNDEGWYQGQCRFSKLAPAWGEFYLVQGDSALLNAPQDWKTVGPASGHGQHLLFYFRDNTFECVTEQCLIEPIANNSLQRTGKKLRFSPAAERRRSTADYISGRWASTAIDLKVTVDGCLQSPQLGRVSFRQEIQL